jgi:hypothetical protein
MRLLKNIPNPLALIAQAARRYALYQSLPKSSADAAGT